MSLILCRNCKTEIMSSSMKCPQCHVEKPFACAECHQHIGMVIEVGPSFPFDAKGQPLCSQHARTRCGACQRAVAADAIMYKTVTWELIQGEYYPSSGPFCKDCGPKQVEPTKPTVKPKSRGCLPMLCCLVGIVGLVPVVVHLLLR